MTRWSLAKLQKSHETRNRWPPTSSSLATQNVVWVSKKSAWRYDADKQSEPIDPHLAPSKAGAMAGSAPLEAAQAAVGADRCFLQGIAPVSPVSTCRDVTPRLRVAGRRIDANLR